MWKCLIRTLAIGAVAALIHASPATAGCDFEHPRKAKLFQADLVQAFTSCALVFSNGTTASGTPSCRPPETFNQQAGTPVNGWQWWEQRSLGRVSFREIAGDFGGNSRDLRVKLRLRNILDGAGGRASGSGTLSVLARATLEDTVVTSPGMGTDMTIIDFPAPFAITMENGNATLGSSANVFLTGLGLDPLPGCTSIELVALAVLDPNGNVFASPGIFLKDLPN